MKKKFYFFLILAALFTSVGVFAQDFASGLQLHYTFDNIDGTNVPDVSGNLMTGTLNGAAAATEGKVGQAISLTAQADFVQLPNDITASLTDFTVGFWAKVSSYNDWARFFDFGNGQDVNMFLSMKPDGQIRFVLKKDATVGEQVLSSTSNMKTGEWTYLAVTGKYDEATGVGTFTIYINGIPAGTKTDATSTPASMGTTLQNYIGKSQYTNDPTIDGAIDEFRIYNRALTEDDITALIGIPPALVAAFKEFELTGLDNVTENLILPTTYGTGGVTISWATDDSTVITTAGVVTPPSKFNAIVSLTATFSITVDGVTSTMTRTFIATVPPVGDVTEIIAQWFFTDDMITTAADGTVTVKEESENEFVGTLMDGAQVVKIGKNDKINVLSVNAEGEYFDMGDPIGEAVYALTDYTVSLYYRKDTAGGFAGYNAYGQLFYAFSNSVDMAGSGLGAMYYEPKRTRHVNTPDNYSSEPSNYVGFDEDYLTPYGSWHHICYSQLGTVGTLYIDGVQVATGTMKTPSTNLKRAGSKGTIYNFLGKNIYNGDTQTTKTLFYGFQMYALGLSVDDINTNILEVPSTIIRLDEAYAATPYDIYIFATFEGLLKQANAAVLTGYQPSLADLNAAIVVAQAAYDAMTVTAETNTALSAAITAYNDSKVKWDEFAKVIATTDAYVATGYPGLADFQIAIDAAKAQYNAFEASDELIQALKDAIATYKASQLASKDNPLNYTDEIVNPSFEEGEGGTLDTTSYRDGSETGNGKYQYPNGWTVYLNHTGWCNAQFMPDFPSDGSNCYETWAGTITEFNVYQDVELPAGNYILSGDMRTDSRIPSTQHVYATNAAGKTFESGVLDTTKIITGPDFDVIKNWQSLYAVVKSTGGITRIGFKANGFMQIDNMRLAYFGSDSPAPVSLTSKIVNAGFEEGTVAGVDSTSIKPAAAGTSFNYNSPIGWVAYCDINPAASQVNMLGISGDNMSEGTNAFETWSPSGGNINQFKVYQKIKAPATGYFKLAADLRCDTSSPSVVDSVIYDGKVFAKVAKNDTTYSIKLGEAEGLITGTGWNAKTAWRTLSLVFKASIGEEIDLGVVSTSFMQFDNFTLSYYAVSDPNNPVVIKKIGYYTFQKTMDAAAATVDNDPIYRMLAADEKLNVTLNILTDVSATAVVDQSPYDLVIVQQCFASASGILTPSGGLGLANLTKPTLWGVAYAFKSGRGLNDGSTATGGEMAGVYTMSVDAANQTNTLFNGINVTSGSFPMFTVGADDLGSSAATKALNYATDVTGVEGTLLAYPTGSTPSIGINDIPAGTTIGDQLLQSRIITFGVNFGALCRDNGANVTNENYTLWRNAVYSLAGLAIPTTPVETGNKEITVKTLVDIYPNPATNYLNIRGIDAMSTVKVFNAMGQQVFVSKANGDMISIDLTRYNQGIYLLQVESNGKAVVSKFIKK